MRSRSPLPWLLLVLLAACSPQLGRVKITVVFENETRTQCIKASAKTATGAVNTSNPAVLPRGGKGSITIGLGETAELLGEVRVTVSRFTSSDCTGTAFASETKTTEIVHAGPVAMLEFRYSDPAGDGGTDGGADGGVDGGCDTMSCGNAAGACEEGMATGCATDGGCRFGFRAPQTPCDGGLCNSMGACVANICAVVTAGTACNDGLDCTSNSTCLMGVCQGSCTAPPQCNQNVSPIMCTGSTMSACVLRASDDFTACGPGGSGRQCLDGGCVPWLQFSPTNFPSTLATTPYPTGAWNLVSPDGGTCDTIVDTTTTPPTYQAMECGAPPITATVNDAGVAVITMTGLSVGPAVRLQFVGSRPVQLLVLGDASIRGIVSVAPLLAGQLPAGTGGPGCNAAVAGLTNKRGGGGGGFGGNGGNGGEGGAAGGALSSSAMISLRGGCPGAAGYRATSMQSPGGTAGGALQLIVADSLTMVGGVVTASGGGGTEGGATDGEGGGGGGSGGAVVIEARNVDLTGGAVTSNGGGGGEGGEAGTAGLPGELGPINSINAPAGANGSSAGGPGGVGGDNGQFNGGNGVNGGGASGGGGGGGAVGVIYVRGYVSCTKGSGLISGAQPMTSVCP